MSLSPEILGLLKNAPLFAGVSNDLLTQHLDDVNRIVYSAGKTLWSPGDAIENIYLVLSGRLRLTHEKMDREPMAMFGAGETVGEMSVLNGGKAIAYLLADTDCELLYLDVATIWSLLNDSHQAALNMLNILSRPVQFRKGSEHNAESQQGYAGLNQVNDLTGLYNTEWMFQTFERQIRRRVITGDHAMLMMVSIDQFDQYNQRHGHLGGDQALRTIAQTVLSCLRPEDQAAHYHGKVIAVFMSRTSLEEGRKAAQRLLSQAGKADIVTPAGDALPHVTVSIGLAEVQPGKTLQELIGDATEALQRAKQAGRNCISN